MRILSVGRVSYDISLPLNEYPVEGKKYLNVQKVEGASGGAGIAAFLFGRWKCESYIVGVIGNDLYGNRAKREYESIGIFTKFLEINYEKDTILNYIIINESKGSRTAISSLTNEVKLTKTTYEMDNPDGIFLDGTEYETACNVLMRYKDAVSLLAATENNTEVLDLCNRVKYIACPLDFAESVTNIKCDPNNNQTLIQIFQAMQDKFKNQKIIISLGNRGVLYNIEFDVRIMPAISVTAKDSTGVGEIFRAALLFGIVSGKKYETTIKLANMTAGLSVTKVGITNSIFKFEEVEKYAQNINESIY